MKKIIKKILLLVIALLCVDIIGGFFLRKILNNSPDGRYYKTIYTLDKSKEDIVIFGSSRAETNYAPKTISEITGLQTWNAGRGGQGLAYWYGLYLGMKERHVPGIVIINVEQDFLKDDENENLYERTGFLRPFYKTHPPIRQIIDRISISERFLIYSDLYAFNSSYYYLVRPFFFKGVDGKIEDFGWKPLTGSIDPGHENTRVVEDKNYKLNDEYVKIFEDFIDDLKKNQCKIFVCVSPDYQKLVMGSGTIEYLKKINDITLIDFSNNQDFVFSPELFKDVLHLNKEGAEKFSFLLANEMLGNI